MFVLDGLNAFMYVPDDGRRNVSMAGSSGNVVNGAKSDMSVTMFTPFAAS
jgi:hypothetical protein